MKKIYITVLCCAATLIISCGKMLEVKPQNSMIPVKLEDFESVLMGGYPKVDFFLNTEYMTDNVYHNPNTTYKPSKTQEAFYSWAGSHQLDNEVNDPYWGQLYKSVYYANSVLDELSKMTPSNDEKELYDVVVGEAHALRAFSYFYLVNLYADVYSEANLELPGVPMPLTAVDVNVNTKDNVREPIGKVWNQIVEDLDKATTKLAGKATRNKFRFDYTCVQMLKSRVFLFMGKYKEAAECATDVINVKSLFDMNELQSYIDDESDRYAFGGDYSFIDSDYNKEVFFYIGGKANYNSFYYDSNMLKTSPELLALCDYEDKLDYRKYIFASFLDLSEANSKPVGPTVYRMYANQGQNTYYIGFKLSEAYVTRAECYVRMNEKSKAIADLNKLLVNRFRKGDFTDFTEADFTADALLAKVLSERRLETAFDCGLRWFDLRRLGKPELVHEYLNSAIYTLKKNDPRYILQIPISEQISSPNMPLNPR